MAIASPNVYKKGYELVNKDMINGWILSEKRPLSIVMAPEGTIEESKSKYYSISVAHFSKKQEKAIEEINQLYIAQKISLQERSDRLKAMAEESRSFMNQIDQYAEKFARINPDDINAIEKQVLELVNAGNCLKPSSYTINPELSLRPERSCYRKQKQRKTSTNWPK